MGANIVERDHILVRSEAAARLAAQLDENGFGIRSLVRIFEIKRLVDVQRRQRGDELPRIAGDNGRCLRFQKPGYADHDDSGRETAGQQ